MFVPMQFLRGEASIRAIGSCLAFVLFGLASGCGGTSPEGYEPHVHYPVRTDPIVIAPPTDQPASAPDPLRLDDYFANLSSRGAKLLPPMEIPEVPREELRLTLDNLFGTPAAPRMPDGITAVGELSLDPVTLAEGSASYRVRCSSCHGMAGDGRGSGAGYPYPRDFRAGLFKRTTGSAANGKPRIEDLHRVIRGGIPGTSMPLFDLLPDDQIRALAAYVVHLSIRGEVEAALIRGLHPDSEDGIAEVPAAARQFAAKSHRQWLEAQAPGEKSNHPQIPVGEAKAESIRRGHTIFATGGCLSCHEGYGRKVSYRYDAWGLPNRVADLTQPESRWGREPADLARAVQRGIPPSNMPATPLAERDRIDLVNFLLALPYPAQLPADVRSAVERGSR